MGPSGGVKAGPVIVSSSSFTSLCKMMLPYVLLYLNSRCGNSQSGKMQKHGTICKQVFQEKVTSLEGLEFIACIFFWLQRSIQQGAVSGTPSHSPNWLKDGVCSIEIDLCEMAFHTVRELGWSLQQHNHMRALAGMLSFSRGWRQSSRSTSERCMSRQKPSHSA